MVGLNDIDSSASSITCCINRLCSVDKSDFAWSGRCCAWLVGSVIFDFLHTSRFRVVSMHPKSNESKQDDGYTVVDSTVVAKERYDAFELNT